MTVGIKFDNNHSVKNNLELVNKIEEIQIPQNSKLASFDVTNMYSNIPIGETIEITKSLLNTNGITPNVIEEIRKLLKDFSKLFYV